MVTFSTRNTNIYKIRKLHRAIFSVFYNISPPNFAILLIQDPLFSCCKKFHSSCQVRPLLVYYANCLSLRFVNKVFKSIFQPKISIIKSMVHNITLLANQTLKVPAEQTVSEKSNSQALKYMQTQVFCISPTKLSVCQLFALRHINSPSFLLRAAIFL